MKNHESSGHAHLVRKEHCFGLTSKTVSHMKIRQDFAAAASPGIKLSWGQRKLYKVPVVSSFSCETVF